MKTIENHLEINIKWVILGKHNAISIPLMLAYFSMTISQKCIPRLVTSFKYAPPGCHLF